MDFFNLNEDIAAFQEIQNAVCRNHTVMAIRDLTLGSTWALKMIDASTKFPEGVMVGGFTDLGNYDECLSLDVTEDWGSFKGRHCLASIDIKMEDIPLLIDEQINGNFSYTWSVCMPSTCTSDDVREFLSSFLHNNVTVHPKGCHIEEPRPFSVLDWVSIGVLCIFGILCVLSTTYDVTMKDPKRRRQILTAFSWYTNGRRLMHTQRSDGTIQCLHGMRFLTMVWLTIGHMYFLTATVPVVNKLNMLHDIRTWGHEFITSAIFAVDTFFFLSGLLVCYIFLKTRNKGKEFKPVPFYLNRFLRLTSILAIAILVHTGLIMHLASGPLWDLNMSWIPTYCKKNWWTAIFHLHNYMNPEKMCLPITWYIAADMQLYLLSPLLLLPLYKWPRFGMISLQAVTMTSVISCFLQLFIDNETGLVLKLNHTMPNNYYYTHTRATPWLVGMTTGYILNKTSTWRKEIAAGTKNGLSKMCVITGWLLATACILGSILCMHFFTQKEVPDLIYMHLYTTFSRLVWPVGLSWIIFACVSGCGGPVNAFLSWKFFQPLSRLTYCIYIIHMSFIRVKFNSMKTPLYYSDMNKLTEVMSTLVYVTLLAIPISLMFEFPSLIIGKVLLGEQKKLSRHQQPEVRVGTQQSDFFHGPQGHVQPFYNSKQTILPSQFDIVERNLPQNGNH